MYNYKKHDIADGVNRITPKSKRAPAGVGWVVLNTEVNDYEMQCLETNTVSILTSEHELIIKCVVTDEVMEDIIFPTNSQEMGSLITWVSSPLSTTPIIIGVIKKTSQKNTLAKSKSFQLQKGDGQNGVLLEGIAENGVFNIIGNSVAGPELNIRLLNKKLLALVDLYIQGRIEIEAEDKIIINTNSEFTVALTSNDPDTEKELTATISYLMGQGFTFVDEFGHQITTTKNALTAQVGKDDVITIAGEQNATEKSLLGESAVKVLGQICDQLTSIANTVSTLAVITINGPATVAPEVTTTMTDILSKVSTIKSGLDNLKSKNLKTS